MPPHPVLASMLAVIAFALATSGGVSAQRVDQPLVPQIFSKLTGTNGYEEYVQAADLIRGPAFELYMGITPEFPVPGTNPNLLPMPPEVSGLTEKLKGMRMLEVWRETAQRYSRALELVRQGSRKRVADPRTDVGPTTLFPELAHFRRLSKLFVMDSYVKFADGNAASGTQSLLDGLEFSYNVSGGSIISSLVAIGNSASILAAVEERLPAFSLADCRRIRTMADALLKAPKRVATGLDVERRTIMNEVDYLFADPKHGMALLQVDQPRSLAEDKQIQQSIAGASPIQLQRWRGQIQATTDRYFQGIIESLNQPEGRWFDDSLDPKASVPADADPIVPKLAAILMPVTRQVLVAEARQRTQFRLLGLHAAILEFKWINGRLPKSLAEAVIPDQIDDPLSGQPFVFERQSSGYRVYSRGISSTGPIELRYRRPVGASNGTTSGPPDAR